MRIVVVAAMLAAVSVPSIAEAADCGPLKIVDRIQMAPAGGEDNRDMIPVTVNGQPKKFLFDTGGDRTQLSYSAVRDMGLSVHTGNIQMIDATGRVSTDEVSLDQFQLGRMRGKDVRVPVTQVGHFDGIIAPEILRTSDFDVDFGTDTINLFSTDHCDGQVVYWKAPSVGVVPIAWGEGYHMTVPVTMDGHEWRALIDTGASDTVLFSNNAKIFYNLTLGDADTPENGNVNGDQTLKTYGHVFKSMTFGNVAVNNPHVTIMPNAFGRNLSKAQLVGDRTKSDKDLLDIPDMIIGMNVLRKLHIYFAMKEDKMYISDASVPAPGAPAQAAP